MNAVEPQRTAAGRAALLFTLASILVLGIVMRLRFLGEAPLFIDEAESSLNALTILEHGYPADTYLGIPLFENTLTEPWPEHPEYEFRDTSYSSRGKAIYHGWLPLYAIAASLKVHGIAPDTIADPPRVQHDDAEIQARIRAVRLPSVAFGALFLVAVFLAGWVFYGTDAGAAAMLAAALAPKCVWIAQQARYYSAALALSTLAVACAWVASRRGRWRDWLAASASFVLLFHTNNMACVVLCIACLPLVPRAMRCPHAGRKLAAASSVLVLGIVPWMLWSGFLEHWGRIPLASEIMDFPGDYFAYLRDRGTRSLFFACAAAGSVLLWLLRGRLPARAERPIAAAGAPVLFLASWAAVAFLAFHALIPAASCSLERLNHILLPGAIVICGILVAAAARACAPSRSTGTALAATLILMAGSGNAFARQWHNPLVAQGVAQMVEHLRGLDIERDTRIYALPNQHFCLTFTTGLPIQSIAPVRKEFLDLYDGEVVILETVPRVSRPWKLWEGAQRAGVVLAAEEERALGPRMQALMIREEVLPLVRAFTFAGEREPDPPWARPVAAELLAASQLPNEQDIDFSRDNPAMFSGSPPLQLDEFWPAFFYRFVGAAHRRGPWLNYAGRMREAEALLLPCNWLVLRCPSRLEGSQ